MYAHARDEGRNIIMGVHTHCLLLVLLSLSGVLKAGDESEDNVDGDITLRQFLERAHALGVISNRQELELQKLASEYLEPALKRGGESSSDVGEGFTQGFSAVFVQTYNQFSLLNVLYFSGALLVMGAFTLFSTLAWANLGYGGVALVLLIPVLLSGFLGIRLWDEGSYPILGGLLCSVSTSMVPFTVYCMQRALKWWPKEDPGVFQGFRTHVRAGWVVMEIATILAGFFFLGMQVHFPFLLFPISWMLWFLSMDLAPFLPEWYKGLRGIFEARRLLSVVFGVAMIIVGRLLEVNLGSDPDFGFWLYLFGLIAFWFAVTFDFPEYELHGSLYLLLNIALCLVGSRLNRTTFHVFSTAGVSVYIIGVYTNHIRPEKSFPLWVLKAFAAVGLLSQALRTGGNIELLVAFVCVMAFNYSFLSFLDSGIHYYTFLLVTTLGFVGCSPAFQRPLDLWFFVFPNASWLVGLVSSLSVLIYHARLLKHLFRAADQGAPLILHMYRLILSVGIALSFFFLRQPAYAWVGGVGIPLIACNFSNIRFLWIRARERRLYVPYKLISLNTLLIGITLAIYLESNILYFVCCVTMMLFILAQLEYWMIGGCFFSIALILLSVPLQSRFMMVIGILYIFFYLTHLAYDTFKNSLLFSLTLIGIGASIIYLGYLYQSNEAKIVEMFEYFTPNVLKLILHRPLSHDWTPLSQLDWYYHIQRVELSYTSITTYPHHWLLWSAALTHALSKGSVPYVSYMCAFGIVLLLLALAASHFRRSLRVDLDGLVKVTSMSMSLSQEHNKHGVLVRLKGTKSPDVRSVATHVALDVSGASFWQVAGNVFGEWKVSFARSVFLPLKLTPHLISFVGFKEKSREFSATILLATGHRGSAKLSHSTISDTLSKLKSYSPSVRMTCTLLYADSWYAPYSKLAETELTLEDITL